MQAWAQPAIQQLLATVAARYSLRSKQAKLRASADGRSCEKKPKPPGTLQVAEFGMLPTALLQHILAQVPLKQKMACEAVCRAWRSVLRCAAGRSAGGVWGHLSIYLDKHAERSDESKGSQFTFHCEGAYTCLLISEALDPDTLPEADFIEWLRLRAPAADKSPFKTLRDRKTGFWPEFCWQSAALAGLVSQHHRLP